MAGINAVQKLRGEEPFILKRDEAYIGVLIDDLINKGTEEPYRMFTSRAEYRILLRQDNADTRLTPYGYKLKSIDENRYNSFNIKQLNIKNILNVIEETKVISDELNSFLESFGTNKLAEKTSLKRVLSRPQVDVHNLINICALEELKSFSAEELEEVEILVKYEGYIEKEKENAEKLNRLEEVPLPEIFDYKKISSLSAEAREKLTKIKPRTIGQASRISGVSPADVSVLLVSVGR